VLAKRYTQLSRSLPSV